MVNSWAKVQGTRYATDVNFLTKITKWSDEGFEVAFTGITDGVSVYNKAGKEIAEIVSENGQDVLRIADDYFVDGVTPIDKYLDLDFPIKVNTGDEIVQGGRLVLVGDEVKFIEDVSSYGSEIVKRTIKDRSKLRKVLDGILRTEDAHHIIPIQLLKENAIVKKAVEAGFKFNAKFNGIAIEKFKKATGLGRHGPHPRYTSQINEVFTKLNNMGINLDAAQSRKLLENLVEGNSKYKGIRKTIEDTEILGPPLNKINEINLGLKDIDVLDLLGV